MKELISIYISLFLVYTPAFAQSKFSVGTPTEDVKEWTITGSNVVIYSNVLLQELRGDYLDISEMGLPRTIYIESIDKIISNKKKSYAVKGAKYGFNLVIGVIGVLGLVGLVSAGIGCQGCGSGGSSDPNALLGFSILIGGPIALGALIGSQIKYVEEYDMTDWSIEEKRVRIREIMKSMKPPNFLRRFNSLAKGYNVQLGVKAGLNSANFSPNSKTPNPERRSFEAVTEFGIGGVMLHPFSEVWDLQVEAMFIEKRSREYLDDFGFVRGRSSFGYTYLSIPVMGRYNLGSGDTSPYIVVGPEFSYLLFADIPSNFREAGFNLKSIELGLNIGAGISMNIKTTPIFGEIRFSSRLTDIRESPTTNKSPVLQVIVGMMF